MGATVSSIDCLYERGQAISFPETFPKHKLQPLLHDLISHVDHMMSGDLKMTEEDLTKVWLAAALQRAGRLSLEEEHIIKECAVHCFEAMDCDHDGRVDFHEFVNYLLGSGSEEAEVFGTLRQHLNGSHKIEKAGDVHGVVNQLLSWDKNGDGMISAEELREHLAGTRKKDSTEEEIDLEYTVAEAMLTDMQQKSHPKMDMWDFIAGVLGRRKMAVEILVYDISDSAASHFSPLLGGQKCGPMYLLAVVAFGTEYWYGGDIFRCQPGCVADCFAPVEQDFPIELSPSVYSPDLQVIHMSYTLLSMDELHNFLHKLSESRYTPQNFDVMKNQSFHFVQTVIHFLTGVELPDELVNLVKPTLASSSAQLLHPFLNQWVGAGETNRVEGRDFEATLAEAEGPKSIPCGKMVFKRVLIEGTHHAVDDVELAMIEVSKGKHVVAAVTAWKGGHTGALDVRYFDASSGKVLPKRNVQRSCVVKQT